MSPPTYSAENSIPQEDNGKMQFLFEDSDFEDSNFHSAVFVAKYRRVTSLESLRDQLREYCGCLKEELYNIINRDYKDFITIATKLEGVDFRVEHLRKPLVDLRMDLTLLNDTMVSNLHVIRERLQQREEVARRRRVVESSIRCTERLRDVELVLAAMIVQPAQAGSEDHSTIPSENVQVLSRRDLIRAMRATHDDHSTQPSEASLTSIALMESSELERASMALASAQDSLREQEHAAGEAGGASSRQQQQPSRSAEASGARASAVALRRSLEMRLQKLLDHLEECLTPRLSALLLQQAEEERHLQPSQKRSLGHLLRALAAVRKGHVAEKLVTDRVITPLIRLHLTQGRVDGADGRGSYSGLGDALQVLLDNISASLHDPLLVSEEVFHRGHPVIPGAAASNAARLYPRPAVDLAIEGILRPVLSALTKYFPAMFSSGIANVFHRSFCAVEGFISGLCAVCGPQWREVLSSRVNRHESVMSFRQSWKLDLHFQLRSQEIRSRIETAFEITSAHGLSSQVFDEVYATPTVRAITPTKNAKPIPKQTQSPSLSLEADLVRSIEMDLTGRDEEWKLPVTRVIVIETLTCLHPQIVLHLLGGKLLGLVVKLLQFYQAYVLGAVGYRSGTSLAIFSSGEVIDGTPQKLGTGSGGSSAVHVDDLWLAIEDSHLLTVWVSSVLIGVAERILLGNSEATATPIRKCLELQCHALATIPPVLWAKISSLLTLECRGQLKAVKSVAGKFRMTNKPPPESPSGFVASILKPLQSFLAKYSSRARKLPPNSIELSSWTRNIVDSVTAAYCHQVQELMETAQQMDNALQRRSKLRAGGAQGTPGSAGPTMTDSEKIALQMLLDVEQFGILLKEILGGVEPMDLQTYQKLLQEVNEGKRIIESK